MLRVNFLTDPIFIRFEKIKLFNIFFLSFFLPKLWKFIYFSIFDLYQSIYKVSIKFEIIEIFTPNCDKLSRIVNKYFSILFLLFVF